MCSHLESIAPTLTLRITMPLAGPEASYDLGA